jgi:DNA processing protein
VNSIRDNKEKICALALILTSGVGRLGRIALIGRYGSAADVLKASEGELSRFGLEASSAAALAGGKSFGLAEKEFDEAGSLGVKILFPFDDGWPPALKDSNLAPEVLYVRGEFKPSDFFSVAVVGSRRATSYGLEAAGFIASELGKMGVATVSGLARGIDARAHRASLDAGARTIAVMGNGLSTCYPAEHRRLADEIADGRGAVVSEFPMKAMPDRYTFPRRNRIIAALSLATVVAEADEKSGALITAKFAAGEGKEVFAVPGPIFSKTSAGVHSLIKSGAKLVHGVSDIVEEIAYLAGWAGSPSTPPDGATAVSPTHTTPVSLEPEEKIILDALKEKASGVSIDSLEHATGIRAGELSGLLVGLEIKGVIRALPGKHYAAASAV